MIKYAFALTPFLLVFSALSACALPGDSLLGVKSQLNNSTLFGSINLDNAFAGRGGLSERFVTDRVNRLGEDVKFFTTFSYGQSEGESVLMYGDLASNKIDRENESSQLFVTDVWGDSAQNDFQNSKFILDKSASCPEGQMNMKVFQGERYYYRILTKDFSTEEITDFQINSLDFLPIFLRDLGQGLRRDSATLCFYGAA